MECPGTNHVVLISKRSNSFTRRGTPTSPANMPREMSSGESSPPYDPSQPATASTSTPKPHNISLAMRSISWLAMFKLLLNYVGKREATIQQKVFALCPGGKYDAGRHACSP